MFSLLYGKDRYLTLRAASQLRARFQAEHPAASVLTLDLPAVGTRPLFEAALPGLFAESKLIIASNPFALSPEAKEVLQEWLNEPHAPESQVLFVETDPVRKNDKLLQAFTKKGKAEEILPLQPEAQVRALRERLAEAEGELSISREAEALFLRKVGADAARFFTELEKLALCKTSGTIEAEDVDALVMEAPEDQVFSGLDALARGQRGEAMRLLRSAAAYKKSAFPVLALIAWQLRQLLILSEAAPRGGNPRELASRLGMAPFTVSKNLGVLKNFPLTRSRGGLTLLAEYDRAIKRGDIDEATALDLIIWKM